MGSNPSTSGGPLLLTIAFGEKNSWMIVFRIQMVLYLDKIRYSYENHYHLTFFMVIQSKNTFGDKNMDNKEKHSCKTCGKSFDTKDDLMEHAKKAH